MLSESKQKKILNFFFKILKICEFWLIFQIQRIRIPRPCHSTVTVISHTADVHHKCNYKLIVVRIIVIVIINIVVVIIVFL